MLPVQMMNPIRMNRKGLETGLLYWLVHFLVEIMSFSLLGCKMPIEIVGLTALMFDALAFVPQAFFGLFIQKFRKVDLASIAVAMLGLSVIMFAFETTLPVIIGVVLLALGNAILHEYGAIETVRDSKGAIAPSAIFVGGGSFGLVLGKFFFTLGISTYFLLIPVGLLEVLVLILRQRSQRCDCEQESFPIFDYCRPKASPVLVIVLVIVITAVRGYIGYAIPISWCESFGDFLMLYFFMGTGKMLGGILTDRFGAGNVGVVSALACIPFLILGANNTFLSVIGVMMFSMTMAITYGMGLSVIPNLPGVAFGATTIGLFIGTFVTIFFKPDKSASTVLVVSMSVLCSVLFALVLKTGLGKKKKGKVSSGDSI